MAHVALRPGSGRVARFGNAIVFIPATAIESSAPESVDQLLHAFAQGSADSIDSDTDHTAEPSDAMNLPAAAVPFALIDWSSLSSPDDGPWESGSGVRITVAGDIRVAATSGQLSETVQGVDHRVVDSVIELADTIAVDIHVGASSVAAAIIAAPARHTDLVTGVVPAESVSINLTTPAARAHGRPIDLPDQARQPGAVDPPPFSEVVADDNTLTPGGSVSWPDDTSQPSDATQRRPARPAALALQLPDGAIVPVDTALLIGREPDHSAARLTPSTARSVVIDAPTTVSRTHLLVRRHMARRDQLSVVDCASRGSTAILSSHSTEPEPIDAWQPRDVSLGDRLLLGGPTTITVVGVAAATPHGTGDATLDGGITLKPTTLPRSAPNTPLSESPEAHQ